MGRSQVKFQYGKALVKYFSMGEHKLNFSMGWSLVKFQYGRALVKYIDDIVDDWLDFSQF